MKSRHYQFSRFLAAWMILLAALLTATGCIIPVKYSDHRYRENTDQNTRKVLIPGVTNQEEIILTLGEPDFVSEDGRQLGYAWSQVRMIWIIAGPGAAIGQELQHRYVLDIQLDQNKKVSEVKLFNKWKLSPNPNLFDNRSIR